MDVPLSTSAVEHRKYFPGRMTHLGEGAAWQDILVEIHHRPAVSETMLIPAVAEPQLQWQISGHLRCEDREVDGQWEMHQVEPGDLFLITEPEPYELRWQAIDDQPVVVMHVTIGLPLLARAAKELFGAGAGIPLLREFNGERDPTILALLEMLRRELVEQRTASVSFVQGVAQALALHLVRTYRDDERPQPRRATALPAFHLQQVLRLMEGALAEGIQVGRLAAEVGMSESHFSRMFKGNTGFSPSRYFIRLRISKAQELLRQTTRPIIEIGLEVGYASPSHFAHVFRRETGTTPQAYREHNQSDLPPAYLSRIATA
ncbi:helix-turn-helix domain-containing protein [Actomonas aquatica]|uniref:Helix-turn-helix domain-containing protein n=1 Tax=Actomonas aquatica TaxID=2866162 RepID=A0ABZ1C5H8_9BACT|nr:helix-turn-helix domain-containing protein [Opitutus sp. WL0086]WRQ86615.1 helix-turn-helix domain-containing protein [Opitutus sp. WL0086]